MPNDNAGLPAIVSQGDLVPAGFGSAAAFKLLYRAGEMLASAEIVPDTYRNKPADCALIVEISQRINASPLMVANSLDIIHGRPSWRSTFLIACVNRCGRFSALRYEWRGEEGAKDRACRCWARELQSGDRLDGIWITWKMVEAEGWSKKNGSKWLTMADQMFTYRAAAFWTRAYAPDIALGFPTDDEVRDVIDITPMNEITDRGSSIDAAKDRIRAAMGPTAGATIEGSATPNGANSQAPEPKHAEGSAPPLTLALLLDKFKAAHKAKDIDLLDAHADLLKLLPSEHQAEATAEYKRLRAEIAPA